MNYIAHGWGYPQIVAAGALFIGLHEIGLRRLIRRSSPEHARRRRRRIFLSYAGVATFVLSVCSPLQFWSMEYFWVHMLQHITVMLAAPALYVFGQPFIAIIFAVPVTLRRRILRRMFVLSEHHYFLRAIRFATSGVFAIVLFNLVMVVWMLPPIFNPVMASERLHISLMLTSFFVSGLLFWLQFIPSSPFRPRMSPYGQIAGVLSANGVMIVVSIAISFFTTNALYDMGPRMGGVGSMAAMAGMAGMSAMDSVRITLSPVADQQIGASILWVCGDFWALPALIIALRRMVAHGGRTPKLVDRLVGASAVTTFRGIDLTR